MDDNISFEKKEEKKEKISLNLLLKIKSKYFLENLFQHLKPNLPLKIMKYNEKLQNKLNISIKDYKILSETEIEIKSIEAKYGIFINYNKEQDSYIHIYFNNTNEEIKRNYINENDKIITIKIIIDYPMNTFIGLFKDCKCIESIDFIKCKRKDINSMREMFSGCSSLKKANLSNINLINTIDMKGLFSGCTSLQEVNIPKGSLYNITQTNNMFKGCTSLKQLKLRAYNTNSTKAINVNNMFDGCSSLKALNLSNFNINNVIDWKDMFSGCSSLANLKFL